MFEGLSEKLEKSFKILKGHGHITEINVAETLKEVRKAMTAVLRRAAADPSDRQCVVDIKALKARQEALKTDIVAIKAGL